MMRIKEHASKHYARQTMSAGSSKAQLPQTFNIASASQ